MLKGRLEGKQKREFDLIGFCADRQLLTPKDNS